MWVVAIMPIFTLLTPQIKYFCFFFSPENWSENWELMRSLKDLKEKENWMIFSRWLIAAWKWSFSCMTCCCSLSSWWMIIAVRKVTVQLITCRRRFYCNYLLMFEIAFVIFLGQSLWFLWNWCHVCACKSHTQKISHKISDAIGKSICCNKFNSWKT